MAKTSRSRQKTAFHAKGVLIGKKCSYTEIKKYTKVYIKQRYNRL
jgi:hypothetical protein